MKRFFTNQPEPVVKSRVASPTVNTQISNIELKAIEKHDEITVEEDNDNLIKTVRADDFEETQV